MIGHDRLDCGRLIGALLAKFSEKSNLISDKELAGTGLARLGSSAADEPASRGRRRAEPQIEFAMDGDDNRPDPDR